MSDSRQPEIVAHRGESHDAPENTLAAFRLAWERGSTTLEFDVRMTADRRLIVCHDADTFRTTGVRHDIAETPLATLRALDAGSWKGQKWTGERLPTLEEVLQFLPTGRRLWIEVKSGPATIEPLAEAVHMSGISLDQVNVISFDDATVREAGLQLQGLRTYLIASFRRGETRGQWSPTIPELIERALAVGACGINVHFIGPVSSHTVRLAHDAGLEIGVWTVDSPNIARRMVRSGVDTITSNRPSWLRAELGLT